MIWLTILLCVLTGAVSFLLGIRYCYRNLLPTLMARMTPEEMKDLARRAAAEVESASG